MSDSDGEILYDIDYNNISQNLIFTYTDVLSQSPLIRAIQTGEFETFKSLAERSPPWSINNVDNKGNTPIHVAVINKNKEVLHYLLEHPAVNVNAKNWEGMTPLFLSLLLKTDDDLIEMIINNDRCDVNMANNEDVTALHLAVQRSTSTIGNLLIQKGADIEATDFDDYTPMLDAIRVQSLENIYMLFYYNADLNIKLTDKGINAIEMAITLLDDDEVLDILANYIVDPNDSTFEGATLLYAALNHRKNIALKLLENGADPCFQRNGISCLGIIASRWNAQLFETVWSQVDLDRFVRIHPTFLSEYLRYVSLDKGDFLRCLYRILSSHVAGTLCESTTVYHLFCALIRYECERAERIETLYICLSLGIIVTMTDLLNVCHNYGFDEELETFMRVNVDVFGSTIIPTSYFSGTFTLLVYPDCDHKTILMKLVREYIDYSDYEKINSIAKLYNIKSYLSAYEDIPEIARLSGKLNTVASLKEIARNAIRKRLHNFDESKPFGFYTKLKRLNLPQVYFDIIVLKRPIYNSDNM